jgi:co-chaperonin GroES (HSP10)
MSIKAKNNCVWVIREIPDSEIGGIYIPDTAKKKAHKGKVISVGKLVEDKSIAEGMTVVFNQTSGFEIELDNITYVVLRGNEIVGEA